MRKVISRQFNIAFSHDVMSVILVFQNNETAAMLVFQTNPVGVELSLSLSPSLSSTEQNENDSSPTAISLKPASADRSWRTFAIFSKITSTV